MQFWKYISLKRKDISFIQLKVDYVSMDSKKYSLLCKSIYIYLNAFCFTFRPSHSLNSNSLPAAPTSAAENSGNVKLLNFHSVCLLMEYYILYLRDVLMFCYVTDLYSFISITNEIFPSLRKQPIITVFRNLTTVYPILYIIDFPKSFDLLPLIIYIIFLSTSAQSFSA